MSSELLSRQDLRFLLHEWLDVASLCERERFAEHSRDTFDDILALAKQIAADHFSPHNRLGDENEPHLDEAGRVVLPAETGAALRVFADSGLLGAALNPSVGGAGLPQVVASAAFAWFQAANVGVAAYPFLTMAAANLLIASGTPRQIATWAEPMADGRFFGTMCLSEPQAGSSLGDISTRAEPEDDGSYRIFGNKMWISGGDHELADNIVHLVLAKIPGGPPGPKGISLFIVPKWLLDDEGEPAERNDVVLAGINHKMGFRATINTALAFGDGTHSPGGRGGAVGYLVGAPHQGLAYMFQMMNEARIGVGLGAACLGYTGYLKSVEYARERPQGRPLRDRDPDRPQVPIIEHTDVKRMLLAQKSYVEGSLALVLYCGRLVDDQLTAPDPGERERAGLLLEVLTPIVKSWPSQWCLAANDLAIQVHGGYGYSREYDVEQHYRDNRLNPIHEGTHGIQALDLLARKVRFQDGAGLTLLAATISDTCARAEGTGGQPAELASALALAVGRLQGTTAALWEQPDAEAALANASVYLEAAGHIVIAWIWLEQMLASSDREGTFYAGKRAAAAYFFSHELPRVHPQLDLLCSLDRTTIEMRDEWF